MTSALGIRWGRVALATIALLLGLAGLTAYQLVSLSGDLREAKDLLQAASSDLTEGHLEEARQKLARAEGLVLAANERLHASLSLDLVGALPVGSQTLGSLRDSVDLAATVIHGGRRILDEAVPLESPQGTLEVSLTAGAVPVDALDAAGRQIRLLLDALPGSLDTDADGGPLVLPQAREVHREVVAEAAERRRQLRVLGRGVDLLGELAGGNGSRRYLLAVANTAEMRGSGGMILSYGVLEGEQGKIDLTHFGDIDELAVREPVATRVVPADYLARWEGFDPLLRFRQANLAGDLTIVAPVVAGLYESATGQVVDGVIQVDPVGLAAILEGIGPVTVPEIGEVSSANAVAVTLNEAYLRFPDVEARTDVLGDVAEATFRKLVDGDYPSVRPLAESLARAVEGRHLLLWSSGTDVERVVRALGADGAYPELDGPAAFALTAQNLSGNKLDFYLDTALEITGSRPTGEIGGLDVTITLTNTAPSGAVGPRYIFGPGPGGLPAGTLRSLVTLYAPPGTSVTGVGGDPTVEPVSSGTEGGRPYAAFIVDLSAGATRQVVLSLELAPAAPGDDSITVVPSPRVRPTSLRVDVRTGAGRAQGTVELDHGWTFTPGGPPAQVVAPAYR